MQGEGKMKPKSVSVLAFSIALGLLLAVPKLLAQETKSANSTSFQYGNTRWFPNVWDPYTTPHVPPQRMSNSERLHSLLRDGALHLTIDDAITLALENNLDIAVSRYNIAYAVNDLFRTKGGGAARGFQGAFSSAALFAGALGGGVSSTGGGGSSRAGGIAGGGGATQLSGGTFDPSVGFSMGWDRNTTPLGTTVITGVPFVTTQTTSYSAFYQQAFLTGTSITTFLGGGRQSTTSLSSIFNPSVSGSLGVGFSQPLLNGFGYRANAQFIRIANNDLKVADSVFRQQVITTVAQVLNLYWDLLAFKENVRVAEQALAYAQKLYSDNKRQVEIGTLAPIEVVRAESEVAARQQDLIVAQTSLQQQAELVKTALTKQVTPDLASVPIAADDHLPEPKPDDVASVDQALKLAAKNRPEVEQLRLKEYDQHITIQGARNRLLPSLNIFATYLPTGLSGNLPIYGSCPAGYAPSEGGCYAPGLPPVRRGTVGAVPNGASQLLSQVFHGRYPDYSFGANLSIPIRNRQAQADAARALLEEHQLETQLQQQKNNVEQQVRSAVIAVIQAKAQIEAARKAVVLAQQTLDAEQKKFQLGESTPFLVIQAQRDLATAEGNEVKARSTYAKAVTQYQQSTATILDTYHIEMNDAVQGKVTRPPNIPGTPSQPASSAPTAQPQG
jgi:outer membrane protein